jgi:predicted dehydrogenase
MKNKKLNISVIGLGVGYAHAKAIKKEKNLNLLSIFDVNKQKSKKLSKILNCDYKRKFEDIFENKELDGVVIASPDDKHCEQIITSIKNSKSFFCEKPFCNNYDELIKIKKVLEIKKNTSFESNLILRTVPVYKWLKDKIKKGYFGEIYSIEGSYLYGRSEKITKGWRGKAKNYSGMNGGGIHMIDLVCWLLNKKPKEVYSYGNKICFQKFNYRFMDFENSIFYFDKDLTASINVHLGCIHKHHHILKIYGTKKTFIYDDKGARLITSKNPKSKILNLKYKTLPTDKTKIMKDFFLDLLKNNFNKNKMKETFDLIKIIDAGKRSLNNKKKIKINYD